jgi:hypothetical protein
MSISWMRFFACKSPTLCAAVPMPLTIWARRCCPRFACICKAFIMLLVAPVVSPMGIVISYYAAAVGGFPYAVAADSVS